MINDVAFRRLIVFDSRLTRAHVVPTKSSCEAQVEEV